MDKDKGFQLTFESVNGINSTIVPRARSSHSERAVTEWWRGTWYCDRARRGGSQTCSGGRCGRRRDEVG